MIKTFADKETRKFYETGKSKKISLDIQAKVLRKLDQIDASSTVEALELPPSNRLRKLRGNREDQYSISLNMQWRICFRFEDGNALDVEICDYH
ncbi:type II toxin-antitoxin system RelE/ParE family toxin [Adlercreutzia sp. ZJ154]|uniref:type II toxin-antitoxin system RelE/ParE family toxin n=1 Tax=Adlercreutzia sp. ZJ154 TaxID=2709790 RepID=UPI0013EA4C24|nr:type II toxin-antitoxin system RelE/ParE family toxin [Adlercreutzia sp. ZJ154]